MKPKLIIHICCAPCAIMPILNLQKTYDIIGLFFNPNIHPYKEYLDRKGSVEMISREFNMKILYDEYPFESFLKSVLKKKNSIDRCEICYKIRLTRLKEKADQMNISFATTTLLYSIYQKHDLIKSIAEELLGKDRFLYFDYRPEFWQGVTEAKSREYYRQKYCGCLFSNQERYNDSKK